MFSVNVKHVEFTRIVVFANELYAFVTADVINREQLSARSEMSKKTDFYEMPLVLNAKYNLRSNPRARNLRGDYAKANTSAANSCVAVIDSRGERKSY